MRRVSMIKRGDIYLVNFGKKYNSEFGKIRPALIIQNDIANRNIEKVSFKGVTVMPLSSSVVGGDLRVKVLQRENLEKDSEICVNELFIIRIVAYYRDLKAITTNLILKYLLCTFFIY